MYDLCLCLMIKNENEYVQEWLDYHLLIGVQHVFVYDNASQVSMRDCLREYINRDQVTVMDIEGSAQQLFAYDHCVKTFGAYSRWIGFIDTDEFIVPKTTPNLREFLQGYEDFGGLAINWKVYGPNGHIQKPNGGMISNYIRHTTPTLPENRTVKSIVHPELVSLPNSPHHFIYQPGSWCVNEVKQRVDNQLAPHIAEKIQINHYWSRSENEYFQKLERGRGDGGDPYPFERLKYTTDFSVEMDLEIFNILAHYEVLTQDEVHQIITDRDFAQAVDLPGRLHRRILDLPALPKPFRLDETRVPPENEPISYLRKMDGMIKLAAEGKDIELVEEYLQNIIALYPEGVMFRLYLADIYILLNDPPKSWNALAGAWKIAPRSFEVLFLMGKYYQALNQYEQAEKIYRLLLQQDPEGFSAMFNLAAVLIHTHSFDEAFALVTQAIHLFSYTLKMPELLDVVKTLGVYYYKNGELERAREMYQKALEYNPDDLELLSNLGRVCLDMERYDAAQAYLTRAVEIHPDDEELKIGLHLVRARLAANHQPAA